jgi:hypothetical protein
MGGFCGSVCKHESPPQPWFELGRDKCSCRDNEPVYKHHTPQASCFDHCAGHGCNLAPT